MQFLSLAFFCAAMVLARADAPDRFYEFSTGASYKNGALDLFLFKYSEMSWNGRPINAQDTEPEVSLKPGDVVAGFVCEDYSQVIRFRLDRLTSRRADFTVWKFAAVTTSLGNGTLRHSQGRLVARYPVSIDLTQPNGLLVDYGFNHVQLGAGLPQRSKPLR